MLVRKAIFPVYPLLNELKDQVENPIGKKRSFKKEFKIINGLKIKITSQRYKVFQGSIVCSRCGVEGFYFAAEMESGQPTNSCHLNLYAVKNGKEVLMTKDHIKPKAKGGTNTHNNYVTMCTKCNVRKSDKYLVK